MRTPSAGTFVPPAVESSEGAEPIDRFELVDVFVCFGFVGLLLQLLWRLGAEVHDARDVLTVGLALVLGVVATDLTSGVVHWFCDTFFAADTPVLGRALIHPFREHHTDPLAMTRRDFFRTNRKNIIAISVVLLVVLARRGGASGSSVFVDAWWLGYAVAVVLTNEFHKLAHAPRVPRVVRRLQTWGVILAPARHARHHDGAYGRSFCVTTGWLNPLLDRLDVFGAVERWVGPR